MTQHAPRRSHTLPPGRPLADVLWTLRRLEVAVAPLAQLAVTLAPLRRLSIALSRFADPFGPDRSFGGRLDR